jgi:hypothetical protein
LGGAFRSGNWTKVQYAGNPLTTRLFPNQACPSCSGSIRIPNSCGYRDDTPSYDALRNIYSYPDCLPAFNAFVKTVPGKGWNVLFRLYGALEPWFDKTWRPGEFVLVN